MTDPAPTNPASPSAPSPAAPQNDRAGNGTRDSGPEILPGTTLDVRVAASVENWKRRLLDLSKRNRALNFRPTKVSTVAILDEDPAEVFRTLYLREREMTFAAAPDETASEGSAPALELSSDPAFLPYDAPAPDARYKDAVLQTASPAEALDRSLRRLDEQARLAIEEQGVNTLFLALGMLQYTESADAEQTFRAPLVMLPVELSRRSARSGYRVAAGEDDPIVNPALVEYLRADFGITLPELPDSATIADDFDLQTLLDAVAQAVGPRKGWSVSREMYLALFSFQKLVMYKDLESNAPSVTVHRLVRQLVGNEVDRVIGLPDDVRRMELDREFPPEATAQVVDADASQLRAIAAAARGHDLVLEGPPGTGKSQTITNLIAQALAAGKSVLFVAEKMAALDVVHSRLVKAGLGEFCLELHSTKASKRAVMRDLAAALDASLHQVAGTAQASGALPALRTSLNEYVQALHTPHGALGMSPYAAFGELARVRGDGVVPSGGVSFRAEARSAGVEESQAYVIEGPLGRDERDSSTPPTLRVGSARNDSTVPRLRYTRRVDDVTRATLDQTVRELRELAAAAAPIGVPAEHPWRDATKSFYTEDDLDRARSLLDTLSAAVEELLRHAEQLASEGYLPSITARGDVETAKVIAEAVARSPGVPEKVLRDERWNTPPREATQLLARGRELESLEERVAARFRTEVLAQEHAADIAYVERKSEGVLSVLAWLDGRWRAIRKRWISYRLPSYSASLAEQANDMKQVDRLLAERGALAAAEPAGREHFGVLWKGEASDWDALDAYVKWVVAFRALAVRHQVGEALYATATQASPSVATVRLLDQAMGRVSATLAELRAVIGWPGDYLGDAPFPELAARVAALRARVADGPRWAAFEGARQTVAAGIAAELLPEGMEGRVPFADVPNAFLRAFYVKWLGEAITARPPLARFDTMTHEQRIAEFRRLDQQVLIENRAALVSRLRDRAQERLRDPGAREALPFLQREMAKQRNLSPLRKTLRHAEPAIRAIKPCFLMSPLSVSQYLAGGAPTFDLVIFDEASQLPSEDAVGAIVRGRQLVVVGDPKQLPPTNFFMVATTPEEVPVADDGTPLYSDAESVLEEYMGAGVPMSRLRWHYRSAHESLISFSNVTFYDADLFTFPSVDTGTAAAGLQFELVERGVYEGKGLNSAEARRVADEVVRFAKEQLAARGRGETGESLGVGTFNLRQQLAIQDELEQRRRDDPAIEPFFDRTLPEPFFVKNLENIQGDERDVIFLSVTYARGADGVLRYNFGALNGENGWRRLNVLTTRARRRMRVFSSMRGSDLNPSASISAGPRLLKEFLTYAEHGRLESASAKAGAAAESPFEQEVVTALVQRGLRVVPQVGVAGYRVDIGVLEPEVPDRFVCGIECDGVAYHASEAARDRDRLRQQVLEARGWTIHRVWSTDWFKDRSGQIERIVRLVEGSRSSARGIGTGASGLGTGDRGLGETARNGGNGGGVIPSAADEGGGVEESSPSRERGRALYREGEDSSTAALRAFARNDNSGVPSPELAAAETDPAPYVRPTGVPYAFAPSRPRTGRDILEEPLAEVTQAVVAVVDAESPIHEIEVVARVVTMWDTRAGSRIQARVIDACRWAERQGLVERRGDFLWKPGSAVIVRSRAGTRIPAERIAPEEYRAAVEAVLAHGHAFPRTQLVNEVRAVLGYARTGAALDEAIGAVIDAMLREGAVGEGSRGVTARR